MSHIRNVLVPLDGSPPSLAALEYAVELAEDAGASVDVLHVVAPNASSIGSTVGVARNALDELELARASAIDYARAHLGQRLGERTEEGEPLRTILGVASAGRYDLVVMGTHGRVGRLHMVLGSVAEGVVRNAPCPVLTIRERGGEAESFSERIHGNRSIGDQGSSR